MRIADLVIAYHLQGEKVWSQLTFEHSALWWNRNEHLAC